MGSGGGGWLGGSKGEIGVVNFRGCKGRQIHFNIHINDIKIINAKADIYIKANINANIEMFLQIYTINYYDHN